jgi:hypothetical protein
MAEVIVGVLLTAVVGGLLVPWVKGVLDRRTERFRASMELLDVLAQGLWGYWKLALRVAYYAQQGNRGHSQYVQALERWDSDDSWKIGEEIQIQISKSKRLLGASEQQRLNEAQQRVVDHLDRTVDDLRQTGTQHQWQHFYESLMGETRDRIDAILTEVASSLAQTVPANRAFGRT